MIPLSILDLAPVTVGSTPAQTFANTLDLARHGEALGYRRFWLAEHHNMPGIASAATAVLIGHVAGGTSRIRVGAGGIMLPNHAPLQVAEQFGTLARFFRAASTWGWDAPRAPTRRRRARCAAITRARTSSPLTWSSCCGTSSRRSRGQQVRAVPGAGIEVEAWILGSSLFGAQLAAAFGLPYAFASHFAPAALGDALALYRERFSHQRGWRSRT